MYLSKCVFFGHRQSVIPKNLDSVIFRSHRCSDLWKIVYVKKDHTARMLRQKIKLAQDTTCISSWTINSRWIGETKDYCGHAQWRLPVEREPWGLGQRLVARWLRSHSAASQPASQSVGQAINSGVPCMRRPTLWSYCKCKQVRRSRGGPPHASWMAWEFLLCMLGWTWC